MKNNKLEIENWKLKIGDFRRGMTYVELIVVLSIFSIMTSVVMFNYGDFQAKVDIKNLASDIALKVVEAQKSSLSGQLSVGASPSWKPSYGVFIDESSPGSFIYFADLNNNNLYEGSDCSGECLDKILITKNNTISNLDVFYQNDSSASLNDLTITFTRPNSSATLKSSGGLNPNIAYAQITIISPQGANATIKVYPAGRIQVN